MSSPTKTIVRPLAALLAATLALSASAAAPAVATASPAANTALAAEASAANHAKPGKYRGTLLEEGKPVKKEWIRFQVKGKKVVKLRNRIWVVCYLPPTTYYQLPLVFKMPKATIKKNKIDRKWTQEIELEDQTETLTGRVQLKFRKQGKVTGRVSIDVANCASRLGDPPYWVDLRAKRK